MTKNTLNFANFHENPVKKAHFLRNLGISVIPLLGDFRPDMAKVSALKVWKPYQTQLPTPEHLSIWFSDYDAMGIVLGHVSKLVVLDIDDPRRAQEFQQVCPELTNTFTVRSGNRQLPHYYFALPDDLDVPSCNADGVELRSDGQYIVAPGTVIGGRTWTVTCNMQPRKLAQADLSRILAFLYPTVHETSQNVVNDVSGAISAQLDSHCDLPIITASGLRRFYHKWALKIGRNNALFNAACYARDRGWSEDDVVDALLDAHINQPAPLHHRRETARQREREARRTVASGFSRSARPVTQTQSGQLPNAVRELLLQHKLDKVVRVLDGLLMLGVKAGEYLTASGVYDLLGKFGVGRNTIYEALKSASPLHPPSPVAHAARRFAEITKQCLFGRVTKPGKNRGRREVVYVMPSISDLCAMLRVKNRGSDVLHTDALRSPAAYREALHTALIRRAPGIYPRRWQAARLGVSKMSCRRYEHRAGVQVMATYISWDLNWRTLERIMPDDAPPGQFIEDTQGKRYPPLRSLAKNLLKRGLRLVYRRQDANHYSVRENVADGNNVASRSKVATDVPATSNGATSGNVADGNNVASRSKVATDVPATSNGTTSGNVADGNNVASRSKVAIDVPILSSDALSGNVADGNNVAERLYTLLRELNPQRSMTRKNVQALVKTYGESLVERGMKMLVKRKKIHSPAGFLKTWLRGKTLFQNPDGRHGIYFVEPGT